MLRRVAIGTNTKADFGSSQTSGEIIGTDHVHCGGKSRRRPRYRCASEGPSRLIDFHVEVAHDVTANLVRLRIGLGPAACMRQPHRSYRDLRSVSKAVHTGRSPVSISPPRIFSMSRANRPGVAIKTGRAGIPCPTTTPGPFSGCSIPAPH